MIDVAKLLRTSYYQLLNNHIVLGDNFYPPLLFGYDTLSLYNTTDADLSALEAQNFSLYHFPIFWIQKMDGTVVWGSKIYPYNYPMPASFEKPDIISWLTTFITATTGNGPTPDPTSIWNIDDVGPEEIYINNGIDYVWGNLNLDASGQDLTFGFAFGQTQVPVSDDLRKFFDSENIYLILSSQSGTADLTFTYFGSQEDILLDIVYKSASRVNKEILDNVADIVFGLIFPTKNPGINNLPAQSGIQILNVKLLDSRYMTTSLNNSNTVIRRLLTFRQTIIQN